jgi:hypothetical protein
MAKKIDRPETKAGITENDDSFSDEPSFCLIIPPQSLRPGMVCPRCKEAKIEYDGMLNLVCPNCGLTEAGAST